MIEVQTGSARPGSASNAVTYLSDLGLPQNGLYATNVRTTDQQSLILDFTGKQYTANKLAEWMGLPGDSVRVATEEDSSRRTRSDDDDLGHPCLSQRAFDDFGKRADIGWVAVQRGNTPEIVYSSFLCDFLIQNVQFVERLDMFGDEANRHD